MTSVFDTVFGLPTHALVVHVTVVLLPLAALGGVIIVLRKRLIHRVGPVTVVIAVVGVVFAWLSRFSGAELASRVGNPQPHVELGHDLPLYALGYGVVLLAYWLMARGVPGNYPRPWWLILIGVVTVVAALAVTWATVLTGHSGAEATWGPVVENTVPGQIPSDEARTITPN